MSGPRHRARRAGFASLIDGNPKPIDALKPGSWYVFRVDGGAVQFCEGAETPDANSPVIEDGGYREIFVEVTQLTFVRVGSSTPKVHAFEVPPCG